MKLKDLKRGMVGKLRSGESITVLNSEYCFINGWEIFTLEKEYNEDLTHKENKHLDIMKITYGDKLIWERIEK